MTPLQHAASRLRDASSVLVLTGAGISAESGVPTFRGADGHWQRHRPEDLATPEAFRRDPVLVQGWYRHRRQALARCAPNAAHYAVAELEQTLAAVTVVTQNVDDLHERAGSSAVWHLHGHLARSACADCGRSADLDAGDVLPVRCAHCKGLIRPGVVWFGEALPGDAFHAAEQAALRADVVLCIGTSGVVYPAAGLPHLALDHGAFGIEVNPEPGVLAGLADVWIAEKAGVTLPQLAALVRHADA